MEEMIAASGFCAVATGATGATPELVAALGKEREAAEDALAEHEVKLVDELSASLQQRARGDALRDPAERMSRSVVFSGAAHSMLTLAKHNAGEKFSLEPACGSVPPLRPPLAVVLTILCFAVQPPTRCP